MTIKRTRNILACLACVLAAVFFWSCDTIKQVGKSQGVDVAQAEKVAKAGQQGYEGFAAIWSAFQEMSIKDERLMGESILLQAYAGKNFGTPIHNPELMKFMNIMANAIAENSERPLIPYHVAVIQSNEDNAFSAPGGYIAITSSLVGKLDNEAQLALVIGHEIAHIAQKHALATIREGKAKEGAAKILKAGGSFTGDSFSKNIGDFADMVVGLTGKLVAHSFDLDTEIQSDLAGMKYAMDTGYDPREIIKMLEKLRYKDAHATGSHPKVADRIAKAQTFIDSLTPEQLSGLVADTGRMKDIKTWVGKDQGWK